MRGYLSLSWSHADLAAHAVAQGLAAEARRQGYTEARTSAVSWLGVRGPRRPQTCQPLEGCTVVGEAYAHPDGDGVGVRAGTDAEIAAWYVRNRWGRYVLLFEGRDGVRAVARDPSGALAAHVWTSAGVRIIASETADWLLDRAGPPLDLDWDRVSGFIQSPLETLGVSGLRGLISVAPGELWSGSGRQTLWDPFAVARSVASDGLARTSARLRDTLDLCVSRLGQAQAFGVEVSGGLDSALVGGALATLGHPVDLVLNTHADRPETDERPYAEAVASRLGMALTRRLREPVAYCAADFESTAGDPSPSQNGRDLANDRMVAQACQARGVDVLMTGKGGDALFFQAHTPLAFADLWRRRPVRALGSALWPGVARWTRTSTWSVLAAARRSGADPDTTGVPPAKRLQIAAIRSGLAYYSTCLRSETIDMVHPLMAQPLVEWALQTPVPTLVADGRDRGLARRVFADRLPALVARRRGKGDYAAYFNRQAADNLPFLRDYLLGGRLAAEGVIDRPALEASLQIDALRWTGGAAEILAAVSVEAWVRRWEGRRAGA